MLRFTERGTNGWICNRKYIEISTDIVHADPGPHSYNTIEEGMIGSTFIYL